MGDIELGARLKKAREEKGLKQLEVCEALSIPKVQTLSAYERGVNAPPIETIKKLAILYSTTTDWLFFGEEQRKNTSKTPFDFMKQVVAGVDYFKFKLYKDEPQRTADFGWINGKIYVCLDSFVFDDIEKFAQWWYDLRNLYDNGTLDKDDYETLLNKRLSYIADMRRIEV